MESEHTIELKGQCPFLEIVDEVRMLHRVGLTTREC